MRTRANGRGVLPKLRSSAFHFWTFDDAGSPEVRDLLTTPNLDLDQFNAVAVPEKTPSPVGTRARRFNRLVGPDMLATTDATADTTKIRDNDWTVGCWVRVRALPVSRGVVWALGGGVSDETEPGNLLASLQVTSGQRFSVRWENGAGVDVANDFNEYVVPLNRWIHVVLRKTHGLTTSTVELIVNGQVLETSATMNNPTGGTDTSVVWSVGARPDGVAAAESASVDVAFLAPHSELMPIDEIKTDFRRGRLLGFWTHIDMKVQAEDASGEPRDLTNLNGVDFVDEVSLSDATDNAVATATVTLLREQRDLSVAPLRTDTVLNLTNPDVVTSYDALIEPGRLLEIFLARVPLGVRAAGVDWQSILKGPIDAADPGGEGVTISVRDQGGFLVRAFHEESVVNDTIIPGEPYEKQPSYGLPAGEDVEDVIQSILNDNDNDPSNNTVTGLINRVGSYDPVTLDTPVSPGWALLPFRQKREPVMTAIRNLAGQIGWECRYRFKQGDEPDLESSVLQLYDADRDRIDSDSLLTEREVENFPQVAVDALNVRNVVRVVYPSSETTIPTPTNPDPTKYIQRFGWNDVDGDGQRMPAFYELEDQDSVARYGRLFMEVGEASSSQIDTMTEAQRMVLGIIKDLAEPSVDIQCLSTCVFELETGDVVMFEVVKELWTVLQALALVAVSHTIGDKATTSLQLRGKPSIGFERWLNIESRPGQGRPAVDDPRLALVDSERGPLLRVLRQIYDDSRFDSDAKNLNIQNRDFSQWGGGGQAPPDAWQMVNGVWTTDAYRSSTSYSGTRSVEFTGITGVLQSKSFDMQGGTRTPYSFEMVWQRDAVGTNVPRLTVEWLDVNDNIVDTVDLEPGGPVPFDFPAVPTTAGSWFRSRTDGVVPTVGGSVRGRLQISQSGAGIIRINSVNGYRSAYSSKMRFAAATNVPASATNLYNVPLTGTITPPDEWDSTVQFIDDTASPNPNEGWYWETLEAGRYDVRASMTSSNIPNPSTTARIQHVLLKNATFNSGIESGAGTIIWEGDAVDVNYNASGFADTFIGLNATVTLNAGDRLSLCTRVLSATGLVALYGGTTNYSAFEVTQRLTQ